MNRLDRLRLAGVLVGALLACVQAPAPAPVPQRSAAPLGSYRAEALASTMGRLAQHMRAIDEMLREGPPSDPVARDTLWKHLDAMAIVVGEVDAHGLDPLDPHFGWRLVSLRHDLTLARVAVGAEPPEYYLVGKLTGSCSYCHESRR